MEDLLVPKKKGNPNFGRQKQVEAIVGNDIPTEFDHNKKYQFELVNTYELYKPTDEKGRKVDSLYPPSYILANTGRAYDPNTKRQRKWRFLASEESIWADEQSDLSPTEEAQLLASPENNMEFVNGKMWVSGKEENKIKAMLIQDICENNTNKLKDKVAEFRLINPETAILKSLEGLDVEFEAIQAAGNASLEEMKEYAYALGINTQQSDAGIKRDFFMAAKANPAYFVKNYVNPTNRFKFALFTAMQENIVSPNIVENQLIWVESKMHICDVNTRGNVIDEVSAKAMAGDKNVIAMFDLLKKQKNEQ